MMSQQYLYLMTLLTVTVLPNVESYSNTTTPSWESLSSIDPSIKDHISNVSCPLWTIPTLSSHGNYTCECGDGLQGLVKCDPKTLEISVLQYHCMTYNKDLDKVFVGGCVTYNYHADGPPGVNIYRSLNHVQNISRNLNDVMCQHCSTKRNPGCDNWSLQRTGQMCGSCVEGFAAPVYSYRSACVECKEYKYNWLKYIAVAFLPLTVFYIIVILFRITVTTGSMNGYILVSQIIAAPIQDRLLQRSLVGSNRSSTLGFDLFSATYGIWNLDFFRDAYDPFCLHPNMTTLQTLALDYVIAVYPLFLILITYMLVKLHDSNHLFIKLWTPFYWCFARIRKEWDIHSSLIGAFSTFLLLSYVKILNVSSYLLTPSILYDVHGNRLNKFHLFYDGTYEYFGRDHIPFALLALFMFFVFNIAPLVLLTLYPSRCCFQRLLNYCGLSFPGLHIFMDTFHGSYKFGPPRDCRYFAAFYLMLRLVNHAVFSITSIYIYYPLMGIVTLISLSIIALCRPYKDLLHTVADIILLVALTLVMVGPELFGYMEIFEPRSAVYMRYIGSLVMSVTPFYGAGLFLYWILPIRILTKLKSWSQRVYYSISHIRGGYSRCQGVDVAEHPLPYTFEHSEDYPRAPLV